MAGGNGGGDAVDTTFHNPDGMCHWRTHDGRHKFIVAIFDPRVKSDTGTALQYDVPVEGGPPQLEVVYRLPGSPRVTHPAIVLRQCGRSMDTTTAARRGGGGGGVGGCGVRRAGEKDIGGESVPAAADYHVVFTTADEGLAEMRGTEAGSSAYSADNTTTTTTTTTNTTTTTATATTTSEPNPKFPSSVHVGALYEAPLAPEYWPDALPQNPVLLI